MASVVLRPDAELDAPEIALWYELGERTRDTLGRTVSDRLGEADCWLLVRGRPEQLGTMLRLEARVAYDDLVLASSVENILFRPSADFWRRFESFKALASDVLEVTQLSDGCGLSLKRHLHNGLRIRFRLAHASDDPDLALSGAVEVHGEFRGQALLLLERALRGTGHAT